MVNNQHNEDCLSLKAWQGRQRLWKSHFCQLDITEINGREIKSGQKTFIDFATCGYLNLDTDITQEDLEQTRKWGLRNSWSRVTGTTSLSSELEQMIARELRLDEVRLSQSVSLINTSILSLLARKFPLFLMDKDAHATLKKGAKLVKQRIRYWSNNDLTDLEHKMLQDRSFKPKLVIVDGIYSMKGTIAPILEILKLCAKYDGYLLIDDAHGFGVIGNKGYGVIGDLQNEELERIIYIAAFAKCASNPLAFVGFSSRFANLFDIGADFLWYSGAPSNLHITISNRHFSAFCTEAFAAKRLAIQHLSQLIHGKCAEKGIHTFSQPGSPIVSVRIQAKYMEEITTNLYSDGILGKPAIYPVTRFGDEIVRFSLTAGHSVEQVEHLFNAIVRNQLLLLN